MTLDSSCHLRNVSKKSLKIKNKIVKRHGNHDECINREKDVGPPDPELGG
jgi:hypothetical protein